MRKPLVNRFWCSYFYDYPIEILNEKNLKKYNYLKLLNFLVLFIKISSVAVESIENYNSKQVKIMKLH